MLCVQNTQVENTVCEMKNAGFCINTNSGVVNLLDMTDGVTLQFCKQIMIQRIQASLMKNT